VGAEAPSPEHLAAAAPAGCWSVLYDADCGFCTWAVSVLLAWDRGGRLRPRAIQGSDGQRLLADLDPQQRLSSWHLVSPDGWRSSGGAAFAPLLRLLPGGAPGAAVAASAPVLRERVYRWVVDHRSGLSRLLPAGVKRAAKAAVRRAESGPRQTGPQ
jgi:predicted DCC family thiol-disulfide oxidoreductase YuxK